MIFLLFSYAYKLLYFSIGRLVLHWRRRRIDTAKRHYNFYVCGVDVKCRESVIGCFFKDASPGICCNQSECRNRWSIICFLYYGGCSGRSECRAGDYCDDVQEHPFGGCEFFKQVETLEKNNTKRKTPETLGSEAGG
jgi:hypothetical protein